MIQELESLRQTAAKTVQKALGLGDVSWETVRFQWNPIYIGRSYHWIHNTQIDLQLEDEHKQTIKRTMISRRKPSEWKPNECLVLEKLISNQFLIPVFDDDDDGDGNFDSPEPIPDFMKLDSDDTEDVIMKYQENKPVSFSSPLREKSSTNVDEDPLTSKLVEDLKRWYRHEKLRSQTVSSWNNPSNYQELRDQGQIRMDLIRNTIQSLENLDDIDMDYMIPKKEANKSVRQAQVSLGQKITALENELEVKKMLEEHSNKRAQAAEEAKDATELQLKRLRSSVKQNLLKIRKSIRSAREGLGGRDSEAVDKDLRSIWNTVNRVLYHSKHGIHDTEFQNDGFFLC